MAEQVLVQAQVDKNLKDDVTEIYKALGIDLQTAICVFMDKSRAAKGFPFETKLPKDYITRTEALENLEGMFHNASDAPDMTMEEIEADIAEVRAQRRARGK